MVVVVVVEMGALGVLGGSRVDIDEVAALLPAGEVQEAFNQMDADQQRQLNVLASEDKAPGLGLPYLALVDGLLLFTMALMGIGLFVPGRIQGRMQGVVTLIFALFMIVTAVALIITAVASITLMVALLSAVPFGTLTYLALFGFFNRGGAAVALGLLMVLKLSFAASLFTAQPRLLQNKGLAFLIMTSFLGNVIISGLHGLAPGFLVTLADVIAAVIVAVLAVLWATFLLIGSGISLYKAV